MSLSAKQPSDVFAISARTDQPPDSYFWIAAAVGLIALAIGVLYFPALKGGLLWDDSDNITQPALRSWQGLERIWFQWGATQTYYPVLHTLYWIEYQLWGEATLGYHVMSILFHSISVVLVYLIVRRLRIPGAYLTAAIFAVHPVYVESVAWITEQKNTLYGMFYLASLLAYLHFDENRRRKTYALAFGLFLLSLASKTTAVTLPVALVVVLWWKRGALSWRRDLMPLVPWFALSLLVGIFTNWYERVYVGVEGSEFVTTPVEKCLVASRAVWFYLSKLFWPTNLTFIYPRWEVNSAELWQYSYVAGLLALFAGAWLVRKRWRGPLAALLFFVGTLFPLLGFFPTYIFRYTNVCDHFQYLPSLGIVVLVSAAVVSFIDRLPYAMKLIGQGLCVALVCTLALLTTRQSWMYRNAVVLYQTTIERNPNCWMAYNNLGLQMLNAGQPAEAMNYFEQTLKLKPDLPEAHNNAGMALLNAGKPTEAIESFQQALRLKPTYADAHSNLGNALADLGQPAKAIEQYQQALQLKPDFPEFYNNMAIELAKTGRQQESIECLERALQLRPDYAEAHNNLAVELTHAGRPAEAMEHYRQALWLKPDYADAHKNLAQSLLHAGQTEEAIEHLQQALRLKPGDDAIYVMLIKTYTAQHRAAEAIDTAQKALEIARSKGEGAYAEQIETWLTTYRLQQNDPQNTAAPADISPGSQ